MHTSEYVRIRQHTSAYVSMRQRSVGRHLSEREALLCMYMHTSAYVSIRQLAAILAKRVELFCGRDMCVLKVHLFLSIPLQVCLGGGVLSPEYTSSGMLRRRCLES
jgi:hypothetical protein